MPMLISLNGRLKRVKLLVRQAGRYSGVHETKKPERFCVLSDDEFDRLSSPEKTEYLKQATTAVALLVTQLHRMFTEDDLH